MSERERRAEAKPEAKKRKKYEPPAVISEEVFETLALSCNHKSPGTCPIPPVKS